MAPPAKRRRRNKREDSADDHGQDGDYQDGSGPPATKSNNTLTNYLLSSSPPSSPAKTRPVNAPATSPPSKSSATRSSNGRASPRRIRGVQAGAVPKKSDDKAKGGGSGGGGLRALFSRQAQQRSTSGKRPAAAAAADVISSDPISEDDEISEVKASSSSIVGQRLRKRQRGGLSAPTPIPRPDNKNSGSLNKQHTTPAPSQRFLKPSRIPPAVAPYTVATTQNGEDARPWSERFGPQNLDELAVHKKKVADVRRWLDEVMSGRMRRQRLLVLKGAAGTGKTTTVRLLARELGCELLEWRNPAGGSIGTGFVSYSAQFNDFLGRGGKFGALDLDVDSSAPTLTPTPTQSSSAAHPDRNRRIMLIEEFPNTFFRSSPALASFRSALLQFLSLPETPPSLSAAAAAVSRQQQQQQRGQQETPAVVVLVISETLLATTSASADSLTAHRLLGPEILSHPGVGVIEFNAVAPSLLARALDLVVRKEARRSGRRRTPGPPVLKRLCEAGDVRSAVSSLEFLCLKGDDDADWSAKVAFAKPKRGAANNNGSDAMTRSERDSLELVSRREASLGIFHAVGRVVYNKRQEPSAAGADAGTDADVEAAMPRHLSQHARPHRSHVAVDALMGETGTDPHTFVAALHENYLPSCDGTGPMDLSTPTDYVNECIEHLSLADLMGPTHDIFFGASSSSSSSFRGSGGGGAESASHVLRRDEMMFEVAVRGLLFSLPFPVRRRTSAGDAFKMFYPASLKLWRAREEVSDLADLWASRLLRDDLAQKDHHRNPPPPPFISLGSVARRELLLERLPYTKLIARASSASRKPCQQALHLSSSRLRDLDKIVSFHPASAAAASRNDEEDVDGEMEDAAIAANDDWATDRLPDETSPRRKRTGIKPGAVTNMLAQKLVLSDDDIED